ncbi:HD domain-containing protein [Clostridium sp. AL.422]|uniref:HD domain-containing protein n=1 Tax=Clostridium TaxID=1485 RepID=UPI00293DC27A|nr:MULTISPECIES: HD domain-containing protein [unclassified Clostridium]MDV4152668.1 HD domain-containing protein [Clostridium sp. AL.422]
MDNVNIILNHPKYKMLLEELNNIEKERKFCNHTLEHFLDVARIAYIIVLEKKLCYSKEVIYSIALLHDIGRVAEYNNGVDHHEASAIIAEELLQYTSFTKEEKTLIIKSIKEHRRESEDELSKIIYKSDKLSRNCFNCMAYKECYWKEDKKNNNIKI